MEHCIAKIRELVALEATPTAASCSSSATTSAASASSPAWAGNFSGIAGKARSRRGIGPNWTIWLRSCR